MPRGVSKDLENFKETLEKGVILVGGEAVDNNSIDPEDDTPVAVAIVVNVTGYGPHIGAICAVQGHIDEALQEGYQILEEWEMDHNPDYFKELEAEYGEERASEVFTETFDGIMWELPAEDFIAAIKGTPAEKLIDVVEYEEEEEETEGGVLEEGRVSEPNDARDVLDGLGQYLEHEGHDAPRESARIARMIASAGRSGKKAEAVLEEVNKLIDGHGVEALRDENAWDNYYGDTIATYVNMGDTYETTLLYDVREHEFHVTSWGDWYEAYEAEQEEESEEDEEEEEEDE